MCPLVLLFVASVGRTTINGRTIGKDQGERGGTAKKDCKYDS
jgi:hypothetical protein